MRHIRVYQVDSFTQTPFAGNPAGVVPDASGLSEVEMQRIARELNNSETAFILPAAGPDHDVHVRFFTPTTEVPSCGHATIAAHYVRALELGLHDTQTVQLTGAGLQRIGTQGKGHDRKIVIDQGAPTFAPALSEAEQQQLIAALGIEPEKCDLRFPIREVSTGHAKILIGVLSRETVDALSPNMQALSALSEDLGCNGYFAFALSDDADAEHRTYGRMFAPNIGIEEDPVTGNANGPLGAHLAACGVFGSGDRTATYRARQGDAMGRPGDMDVAVTIAANKPIAVSISGHACIVFRTEMTLPEKRQSLEI